MTEETYPTIQQTVLDTTDPRGLAEFYRQLFGLAYRPGDEAPPAGQPDERGKDWLVLRGRDGSPLLAFQQVDELPPTTWPEPGVPQQMHLDTSVPDVRSSTASTSVPSRWGRVVRYDRTDDEEEPLRVYADPAGHLFCIFVG